MDFNLNHYIYLRDLFSPYWKLPVTLGYMTSLRREKIVTFKRNRNQREEEDRNSLELFMRYFNTSRDVSDLNRLYMLTGIDNGEKEI